MFVPPLETPTQVAAVAEKIRDIIESGTQKLRHPVGPDAEAFLGWRASLTDEQWVEWGALPDDEWYERVRQDFGLDAFCLQDFWATEASFRFIMVAYNLMSLFRHFGLNSHNQATLATLTSPRP